MNVSTRKGGDLIAGMVLAAFGVFIVGTALHWEFLAKAGPGPGFFPVLYGSLMVAISLLLIVQALRRNDGPSASVWAGSSRAFLTFAAFLAAVALMPLAGFSISLGVLTLIIALGLYRRPVKAAAVAAICVPTGFLLIFSFLLGVRLPVGLLGI